MPGAEEDDEDDPQVTVGSNPQGQPAQPTNGQPTAAAPAGAPGGQQEGVHQVKDSEFKQIKEKAKARGRQQALEELDAKARAAGFESHEDALKALATLKKGSAAPAPAPTVATPANPRGAPTMSDAAKKKSEKAAAQEAERVRAEQTRAIEDRAKMRQQWRKEERARRELQAKLDAKSAEMDLRDECYQHGVKDVDYTIRLLTRALEGKTQEEIAKFDRKAFYEGLKKDKPYLFGETVTPATTGTNGGAAPAAQNTGAPPPPAAGDPAAAAANANKFDARKAKPEEVQARLRQLGLDPHLTS